MKKPFPCFSLSSLPSPAVSCLKSPLACLQPLLALLCSCSALFPDVVNCMQTDNLELKKLVYLYLMNYAKSQPDMAIMAVNTFVKVSRNLGKWEQGDDCSVSDSQASFCLFRLRASSSSRGLPLSPEPQT